MTINDWISVTPDNGCGEKTVTITLGKNETGSERTYEVPVYFDDGSIKYITVTQPACGVTPGTDCATSVSASKTIFTFPLSGGTDTFTVTADGDWSFLTSVIASGITASPWHGTSGTTLITLTVEQGSSIDIKENALCAKDGSVIQSGLIEVIRKGDTPTPSPICDDALVWGTYDESTIKRKTNSLVINNIGEYPTVDGVDWALCNYTGGTMTKLGSFMNSYGTYKEYNSVKFSNNFDTSNVTDMGSMFSDCSGLTSLNLSSFNTSKVTNMFGMFSGCSGLTTLDLSNFDTSNVTDMRYMFQSCYSLTSLNLTNFDTSNVTKIFGMFSFCKSLTSLNLSSFNTSKVTDISSMFSSCEKLVSLDLSNFDTSNVTDMRYMFFNCYKLTSLDLSSFDTSNVTSMSDMFSNCTSLTTVKVINCDDATKQKILTQLQTDLSSYTWTLSNGIITRS